MCGDVFAWYLTYIYIYKYTVAAYTRAADLAGFDGLDVLGYRRIISVCLPQGWRIAQGVVARRAAYELPVLQQFIADGWRFGHMLGSVFRTGHVSIE